MSRHRNWVMDNEKCEAIGPRGESCLILKWQRPPPDGTTVEAFSLATGDRLRPTDAPDEFTTINGPRVFRLRIQN